VKGTHVAPATSTAIPCVLVAVSFDPIHHSETDTGHKTSAGSWSVMTTRRRGATWTVVRHLTSHDLGPVEAWDLICAAGSLGGRPYLVCDSPADVLTLLGFWSRVSDGTVSLRLRYSEYTDAAGKKHNRRPHPLVLSRIPEVVGWEVNGREYRCVGYRNHLPVPLTEAAALAGIDPPSPADGNQQPTGHADQPARWQVAALTAVYHRLMGRWSASGWGRWQDTIGAAAWSMWRTTISKGDLLEHASPSALACESAAIYGGRAEVYYYGPAGADWQSIPMSTDDGGGLWPGLGERLYRVDVRSMYASILRDEVFPARLLHRLRCRSVSALAGAMRGIQVLATVRVRLASPSLPYRDTDGYCQYPTGEWVTTLTHPELRAALARDEVLAVYECWGYAAGRPFSAFARTLLAARAAAVADGDGVHGLYVKLLANALGGKLGATRRGWVSEPDRVCRREWGEWAEVDGDTGQMQRLRGIAGLRQRHVTSPDRRPGLAACYAWLTAYGRTRLSDLMRTAGPGTVLACDTDGFVVTSRGRAALTAAGRLGGVSPGDLREDGEVRAYQARTPKHYLADGRWTLAGVRGDYGPVGNRRVRHHVSVNPVRSGIAPGSADLPTATSVLRLDSIPLSGVPGIDGWLISPVVRDGALSQPPDATTRRDGTKSYYGN